METKSGLEPFTAKLYISMGPIAWIPLEHQYPKLGERMGQLMERVDWEDKLPRNIRFMRIKVRIDPWLLVIAGFMLRLDDGFRVWIQCRYERVHKLCIRCGLIRHSQTMHTLHRRY